MSAISRAMTTRTDSNTVYLPRWAWGADSSLPRLGDQVPAIKRKFLVVHHTVMVDDDATANVWESMGEITSNMQRLQTIRPDLGLDVPYNLVAYLMPEGVVVCEGRGWGRSGAHTAGRPTPNGDKYNVSGIGLCFAGNFEVNDPVDLRERLRHFGRTWLADNMAQRGYPRCGTLTMGHRDTKATACPGQHLYSNLDVLNGDPL